MDSSEVRDLKSSYVHFISHNSFGDKALEKWTIPIMDVLWKIKWNMNVMLLGLN